MTATASGSGGLPGFGGTTEQLQDLQRRVEELRERRLNGRMQMEGEAAHPEYRPCQAGERQERHRLEQEAQRLELQREAKELRSSLQEVESEVARLHAMTSSLEARRLEAGDRAREEIESLKRSRDLKLGPREADEATADAELRSELASARHRSEVLRLECTEERQRCRQVVSRLGLLTQRACLGAKSVSERPGGRG
eukprot:g10695.t1